MVNNRNKDKNNSSKSLVFGRWPPEKQSQKSRSVSQDLKRKVVGWILERAVRFSRLQSRDDDCNYYSVLVVFLNHCKLAAILNGVCGIFTRRPIFTKQFL